MVSDLNRLEFDLNRAGLLVAHRASVLVRRTAEMVVREAKEICPVYTGYLRSTIGYDMDHDSMGFEAGPTAHYGAHVEYGTAYQAPKPYLTPVFDRQVPGVIAAMSALGARLLE